MRDEAASAGDSRIRLVRRLARDTVLVTGGLVAICLGGGVGPRYLLAGETLVGVLGCILLVCGLGAAVVGTANLVSRAPGWWRLLAVPAVLAALQFLVLPGVGAVMATHVPPTPVVDSEANGLGLPYRTVDITTVEDVLLRAWWIPSRNRAALVLRHGAGSNRSAVVRQAAVLARHGFGVLLMDARGHGDSEGRAMDFGWWGTDDISAGIDWLTAQASVDSERIGLVGMSMGGEEAIGAAASDPRVRAVVAEGASARTGADIAYLPLDVEGLVRRIESMVMYPLADLMTDAPDPLDLRSAAAVTSSPIMLIASVEAGEVDAAQYIRGTSGERVMIWPVEVGGHTESLESAPTIWESRVLAFLDGALTSG